MTVKIVQHDFIVRQIRGFDKEADTTSTWLWTD